jgi:predicted RNase H-like HicB family nuclease
MTLPTRKDINLHDSLDERQACDHFFGKSREEAQELFRTAFGRYVEDLIRQACDHFFGKSREEAQELFRTAFGRYVEDLMWMGPVAFRYYVEAAIRHIEGAPARGDSAIPIFFGPAISFRLEHEPQELAPVARRLAGACQYILDHRRDFDPDLGEDSDMYEAYAALRGSLLRLA